VIVCSLSQLKDTSDRGFSGWTLKIGQYDSVPERTWRKAVCSTVDDIMFGRDQTMFIDRKARFLCKKTPHVVRQGHLLVTDHLSDDSVTFGQELVSFHFFRCGTFFGKRSEPQVRIEIMPWRTFCWLDDMKKCWYTVVRRRRRNGAGLLRNIHLAEIQDFQL
jgi:hypothetical protein